MEFKVGQRVLISGDLETTRINFGLNEEMQRMKSGIFEITGVLTKHHIIIGRYNWHAFDLKLFDDNEPAPVYDIKNFDPNNLVL